MAGGSTRRSKPEPYARASSRCMRHPRAAKTKATRSSAKPHTPAWKERLRSATPIQELSLRQHRSPSNRPSVRHAQLFETSRDSPSRAALPSGPPRHQRELLHNAAKECQPLIHQLHPSCCLQESSVRRDRRQQHLPVSWREHRGVVLPKPRHAIIRRRRSPPQPGRARASRPQTDPAARAYAPGASRHRPHHPLDGLARHASHQARRKHNTRSACSCVAHGVPRAH